MDEELQALEAELAQLRAAVNAPATTTPTNVSPTASTGYGGLKQLGADILFGIPKGVAGTIDILSYLPTKALQYAGAPTETWGTTKLVNALIEGNQGLDGPGAAEILGVRPSTSVQKAIEFMTPGPGGKGKLLPQLAKESSLGLLAYGGSELGEYATGSPYGALVGALAAPLTAQGLAGVGRRLTSAVSPTANVILGNEEAIRAAAQADVLNAIGEEGIDRLRVASMMPSLQTGTGGVPLTAAEIAQTPSAAQLQQSLLSTPEGAAILKPALDVRRSELAAALDKLGLTPQQGEMSIALREAAQQAAQQKQTAEQTLLQGLGFGPVEQATTPFERGKALQESLMLRKEDVEDIASRAWEAVPGTTKIDATTPFTETLKEFDNFGDLAKADTSAKGQRVIKKVEEFVRNQNGLVTVDELQDLRSAAGRAMKDASGVNPVEARLMGTLRDKIDNAGLSYAYDPTVGMKGGLPGTPGTAPDLEALTKLSNAIEATRSAKQTFSQGAIGEITAIRQFKPKLQPSKVIKKAVETPENIMEISKKVGFDSGEMTEIRMELLSNLTKAANPTEYLGREKEKFRAAFQDQYKQVEQFAQKAGQKAPLQEFAKVTDSAIPNKIFADEAAAARFAKQFADSPVLAMGRSKFISEKLTKQGNSIANLIRNKRIAQKLFGDDFPQLEKVITDLELSKSPARLERELASGNSITNVRQTSLGALFGARGILKLMEKGQVTGALTGGVPGWLLGQYAERIAQQRNSAMNAFQAEMLANPALLKLAEAPPTKENVINLIEFGTRLGYFGARGAQQATTETPVSPTATPAATATEDTEIADLEAELESLRQMLPKQKAKVGKQEISALLDEIPREFGINPKWVKAIAQVESNFNPNAIGPKTKYGQAEGLVQLMPATAKALGVTNSFDPKQAITGASKLLVELDDTYGKYKEPMLLFAAYNSRPELVNAAIRKVKKENKPVTWENVSKYMPKETQRYVDKVLSLIQESIMPWSSGNYTKGNNATGGWTGDASLGIGIEAGRHDTQDNDFADGIDQCLNKAGQNAMTANLNLGGNKVTNAAVGTASTDAITLGQAQAGIDQSTTTTDFNINKFSADANGRFIRFNKSRDAAVGTNTIVQAGDILGGFSCSGANGTGYTQAAAIYAMVDGTPGATNDMPGRLSFRTTPDGSGSTVERMQITNAGNVLVERSTSINSVYKLQVGDSTGSKGISIAGGSSATNDGSLLTFFNGAAVSGQIGNYSAMQGGAYNGSFTLKNAGASFIVLGITAGAGTNAMKWHNATGAWTYDTSSLRYKDNIADHQYGLDAVKAMRPVTFTYKSEPDRYDVGFIAEEMIHVVPEVVTKNADGEPDAISYDRLVSVLCKAIQELEARVAALEGA